MICYQGTRCNGYEFFAWSPWFMKPTCFCRCLPRVPKRVTYKKLNEIYSSTFEAGSSLTHNAYLPGEIAKDLGWLDNVPTLTTGTLEVRGSVAWPVSSEMYVDPICSQRAALLSGDYQYCSTGNYQSCWNWLLRFKAVWVPYGLMVYWFSAFWCTCDHAIHHQLTDHLNQWLFIGSGHFSWNLLLLP